MQGARGSVRAMGNQHDATSRPRLQHLLHGLLFHSCTYRDIPCLASQSLSHTVVWTQQPDRTSCHTNNGISPHRRCRRADRPDVFTTWRQSGPYLMQGYFWLTRVCLSNGAACIHTPTTELRTSVAVACT